MMFDLKNRRFAIGPIVNAGSVTIIRLWRWNIVRAGRRWAFGKHETSIHSAKAVTTEKVD